MQILHVASDSSPSDKMDLHLSVWMLGEVFLVLPNFINCEKKNNDTTMIPIIPARITQAET
jgi:hypothetical protein